MNDNILRSNETIKLSTTDLKPSSYYIQFNDIEDNNKFVGRFVGRFFLNEDKKIDFEGDATDSAKVFIEELKRMWNENR